MISSHYFMVQNKNNYVMNTLYIINNNVITPEWLKKTQWYS